MTDGERNIYQRLTSLKVCWIPKTRISHALTSFDLSSLVFLRGIQLSLPWKTLLIKNNPTLTFQFKRAQAVCSNEGIRSWPLAFDSPTSFDQ